MSTRKKPTLASFGDKPAEAAPEAPKRKKGSRGSAARPGIIVRVDHEDWMSMHTFAMSQRSTLTALLLKGFRQLQIEAGSTPIKAGADDE